MSEKNMEEKISCDHCARYIPKSAALTFEGADYTHYFCCTDCMDYWKKEHQEDLKDK